MYFERLSTTQQQNCDKERRENRKKNVQRRVRFIMRMSRINRELFLSYQMLLDFECLRMKCKCSLNIHHIVSKSLEFQNNSIKRERITSEKKGENRITSLAKLNELRTVGVRVIPNNNNSLLIQAHDNKINMIVT